MSTKWPWHDIASLPNDERRILAHWPPDEAFPEGRTMIWRASMLFDQFARIKRGIPQPSHLSFPATLWAEVPAPSAAEGNEAEAEAAASVAPAPSFADGIDAEGLKREFWHDVGAPSADGRYSNLQIETALKYLVEEVVAVALAHSPQASNEGEDPWNADRLAGRSPAPHFDGETQTPAGQRLTLGQMAAILVGAGLAVQPAHAAGDRPESGEAVGFVREKDLNFQSGGHTSCWISQRQSATYNTPLYSRPAPDNRNEVLEALTRPIIGIEYRTAQEVFDIMADRAQAALKDQINDD